MSQVRRFGPALARGARSRSLRSNRHRLHIQARPAAAGTQLARPPVVQTSSTPRRVIFGDLALSASGLLILVFAIAALDYRFRDQITSAADVAGLGQQMSNVAIVIAMFVVQFSREQVFEHLHLTVLTIAATVLVVCLLRL